MSKAALICVLFLALSGCYRNGVPLSRVQTTNNLRTVCPSSLADKQTTTTNITTSRLDTSPFDTLYSCFRTLRPQPFSLSLVGLRRLWVD
ncbi:hypothetical protein BGX38DRAFT_1164696 [Terfezia claveryi]|nr:hypothetical protein BGX38DRAFT_1164696 [Terfezia claveryi]